jgi:Fe-S cluster assembly protein SufD
LESFRRFENGAGGPAWLRPVREAAVARFAELGFPSPRDEDWKFTNLAPLARRSFALGTEVRGGEVGDLASVRLLEDAAARLVFVNGRYAPEFSERGRLPAGVRVASLADALESESDLLEAHLTRYVDYERDFFSALNTAFIEDGGFVYVPRGVVVEGPIHLLFLATSTSTPTVTHPRNLIVVEELGQVTVVEEYVTLGGDEYFSNTLTELVAGDAAVVEHFTIENESAGAFNVGTLRIEQGRSSSVFSHTVLLGGALVRNNVHPVLTGEGGECLINGLFMPTGRQHMDNFMRVEHVGRHCGSRQFFNGILDGSARGVFAGRIVVHRTAQKTDAKQTNRNILLSDDARVDSKPQLEIHADDVKCTHGATIGQLDEDALFYLRARGVPESLARALLLFGFATENLERMRQPAVRRYVERLVAERLPQGNLLRGMS